MSDQQVVMLPVKSILVSQPKPENPKNPYADLSEKYKVKFEFRQFIRIEGIPSKEFRKQRIDINQYTAVILTSKNAIDHFFRVCEELRIRLSEDMKYFCITEAVAVYLQKYIQFRKRKVFFGANGKESELFDILAKHIPNEKILFPCAHEHRDNINQFLNSRNADFSEAFIYETIPTDLSDLKPLQKFDMTILFTPKGVDSLYYNFPDFEQGNMRIACMGELTLKALEHHHLRVDLVAPTPETPSIFMALDRYLAIANKNK
ncbi:MAG: uroporphyrinogen-III synthase [Chitinophagales bacterium]